MADSVRITHRERRRRKAREESATENDERPPVTQSSDKLFRRDTYILSRSRSDLNVASVASDQLNVSSVKDETSDASVRTYNVRRKSEDTYNVVKSEENTARRPVPAPRRVKSDLPAAERVSSDTDKDVADIDMDDGSARNKSDSDSKSVKMIKPPVEGITSESDESVVVPVPKPRKRMLTLPKTGAGDTKDTPNGDVEEKSGQSKSSPEKRSEEARREKDAPEGENENAEKKSVKSDYSELPIANPVRFALKSEKDIRENMKKNKRLRIADLMEKKGGKKENKLKSSHVFSSIMKLEKAKIPRIASLLKDLKKDANDEEEPEEDNADFQIDSPRYPESKQNGQIYVQDKKGFCIMEREEVLKAGNEDEKNSGSHGEMEDSTVKTAIFFQKYWSRSMMYFHGILAGFAFGHAAMVTALVTHFNYDPKGFTDIYSRLSLKIHYIFYALTTFCIVSCFDRVDIGHINRKHWRTAWRVPSMWSVLCIYIISFALTFANQKTQARFDAYSYLEGNDTDVQIWNTEVPSEIQVGFLTWFHTVWARDVLLLVAWLIISLTKFSDLLSGHLSNMVKYSEVGIDGKY